MEVMVTQGSGHSAITRIEESFCVGDVIIASTAVFGSGVVLRADSGCSITIRDGVCLGPGVIIHASQGAIELHQGVCLAGGVLLVGAGRIGRQACIGSGSTLINPNIPDGAMVSADSLWGDESRAIAPPPDDADISFPECPAEQNCNAPSDPSASAAFETSADPWATPNPTDAAPKVSHHSSSKPPEQAIDQPSQTPPNIAKTVIGIEQFELMVKKMFPDREAFKKSQED